MNAEKREIRNLECQLSFREATAEEAAKGELGTIVGRAICFNVESQVLDEDGQYFREIIDPSAATMEFLNSQDVKINLLHVRELTFGRAKRGISGNARLFRDDEGVGFEVAVPNCDLGIRARELTKAEVYDGCSFEFYPGEYEIEEREGSLPIVRHKSFRAITALTLGMDPAYLQTSLSVREMLGEKNEEEAAKREAEEAEKREQEKREQEERELREMEEKENMQREMARRAQHLRSLSNFDEIIDSTIF